MYASVHSMHWIFIGIKTMKIIQLKLLYQYCVTDTLSYEYYPLLRKDLVMIIQDQTPEEFSSEELHEIDHDIWVAEAAAQEGFPIAGFVEDIYEDAVVLLIGPMFRFDWLKRKLKMGRVIHISKISSGGIRSFILLTEDGTQVSCVYGGTYPCYFALPENTEDKFRIQS